MPPRDNAATRRALDRLRALQMSPSQQAEFAAELLLPKANPEVLQAAAKALAAQPRADAHDALVACYQELAADGRRRDPGGFTRAALLAALQPIVLPEDLPLLEQAVQTREPSMQSADGPAVLRAAALVALLDLDPEVASYHAAAHLGDAERMSGEPAITAARVLAAAGNEPVLVAYALAADPPHPEVLAECLRQLRTVPPAVLVTLVTTALRQPNETVQLGLCDLFVHHRPEPALVEAAATFLRETHEMELYHYLAATIVAERREDLIAVLAEEAQEQHDAKKRQVLADCLAVRRGDPVVDRALAALRTRDEAERG